MSSVPQPPSWPSELSARYTVSRLIAQGGYGAVFLAVDNDLRRPVAVKVLLATMEGDDADRFVDEARVTAALRSDAIVAVYDFGRTGGTPYIVYEYVPGDSLRRLISLGPLEPSVAAAHALRIAQALHSAHKAGIIHRDIKPDNVLLDEEGRAKVTDFGIARFLEASHTKTATGIILGTPAYIAPELINGQRPSEASDLYALGITIYEMVVGRVPFEDEDPLRLLALQLKQAPSPPSQASEAVPRAIDTIVLALLTKDPQRRLGPAGEVVRRLQEFLGLPGGPATARTVLPAPEAGPSGRWPRNAGGAGGSAVTKRPAPPASGSTPPSPTSAPGPWVVGLLGLSLVVGLMIGRASMAPLHGSAPTLPSPSPIPPGPSTRPSASASGPQPDDRLVATALGALDDLGSRVVTVGSTLARHPLVSPLVFGRFLLEADSYLAPSAPVLVEMERWMGGGTNGLLRDASGASEGTAMERDMWRRFRQERGPLVTKAVKVMRPAFKGIAQQLGTLSRVALSLEQQRTLATVLERICVVSDNVQSVPIDVLIVTLRSIRVEGQRPWWSYYVESRLDKACGNTGGRTGPAIAALAAALPVIQPLGSEVLDDTRGAILLMTMYECSTATARTLARPEVPHTGALAAMNGGIELIDRGGVRPPGILAARVEFVQARNQLLRRADAHPGAIFSAPPRRPPRPREE